MIQAVDPSLARHWALQHAIALAQAARQRAKRPEVIAKAENYLAGLQEVHQRILRMESELATLQPSAPTRGADDNPFKAYVYPSDRGPVQTYHCAADDRLRAVPTFDAAQCAAALRVPGLQAAVRKAVERRLRRLQRGATE